MRSLRRSRHAVRVEMTPLIDVIFLLLTFFIYSLVTTIHAQIMPVNLTPIAAGKAPAASPVRIDAITLTRDGLIHYNQVPVTLEQLPDRLKEYAGKADRPRLFVAMEQAGDVDRGPLFIQVIQALREAGIDDFAIVGQPREGDASPASSLEPPAAGTSQPSTAGKPATP